MITVLLGDDRERLLKTLPASYVTLDAENLTTQEIVESLLTVSMFGDGQTYLIKDADKNSGFLAELEKSAEKIANTAEVYIQFGKLAKNTRLYKLLAGTGGVRIVEHKIYVDNSTNFNILPAALSGNRREALQLLKKSQLAGNEPIAVLGALSYKLSEVLMEAHRGNKARANAASRERLAKLQKIGRQFLNAREVLLSGVMDPWLYLATLVTEATVISSRS